jgi:6-phosphofructokinase
MNKATHASSSKRLAIMVGAGHVPGLNSVVMGAAVAAGKLGWETVGIRDGFDGLLYPERYPDGGLVTLEPRLVANLDPNAAGILGQAPRVDPFHVRQVNADEMVEEVDLSDRLLERLQEEEIDAVVGVVGGRGLSILHKLHGKGLNVVCVPRSIENDIAATLVSFGFNTALSFTIDMLDRVRQAAQAARKIGVVEVLGEQAGWLALQAGIAVCADAVLIPEIPSDLCAVATSLKAKLAAGQPWGLVVVAEGATIVDPTGRKGKPNPLKASLSPLATDEEGEHVIRKSGRAAAAAAEGLQRMLAEETFPLVLGPWVRGGAPTAVDRQLGMAYGAGAVKAAGDGSYGTMVAFVPPELKFVPLKEAINKVRTVPVDGGFVQIAHSLGIFLGREQS